MEAHRPTCQERWWGDVASWQDQRRSARCQTNEEATTGDETEYLAGDEVGGCVGETRPVPDNSTDAGCSVSRSADASTSEIPGITVITAEDVKPEDVGTLSLRYVDGVAQLVVHGGTVLPAALTIGDEAENTVATYSAGTPPQAQNRIDGGTGIYPGACRGIPVMPQQTTLGQPSKRLTRGPALRTASVHAPTLCRSETMPTPLGQRVPSDLCAPALLGDRHGWDSRHDRRVPCRQEMPSRVVLTPGIAWGLVQED